jgi:hypothetical protein
MNGTPSEGGASGIDALAAVLSASIRLEAAATPEDVRRVARGLAASGAPGKAVVRLVRGRLAALGIRQAPPGRGDEAP